MDEERTCVSCGQNLPLSEFHRRSDTGVPRPQCKSCWNARCLARYHADPSRHKEVVKRRYDTFRRFDRYGLTSERYDQLLAEQGGGCALCNARRPGGKGKWHIDHQSPPGAKKTGRFKVPDGSVVRGLLCHRCNIAIGHFEALAERVGIPKVQQYVARVP